MTVLRLAVPEGRAFGQFQAGPATPGFSLLACKPFPERRDQIIMRELVILGPLELACVGWLITRQSLRVGRGNQAQFPVQNPEQVVKITRAVGIAALVPHSQTQTRANLRLRELDYRQRGVGNRYGETAVADS